jgi:hypothetical protein
VAPTTPTESVSIIAVKSASIVFLNFPVFIIITFCVRLILREPLSLLYNIGIDGAVI